MSEELMSKKDTENVYDDKKPSLSSLYKFLIAQLDDLWIFFRKCLRHINFSKDMGEFMQALSYVITPFVSLISLYMDLRESMKRAKRTWHKMEEGKCKDHHALKFSMALLSAEIAFLAICLAISMIAIGLALVFGVTLGSAAPALMAAGPVIFPALMCVLSGIALMPQLYKFFFTELEEAASRKLERKIAFGVSLFLIGALILVGSALTGGVLPTVMTGVAVGIGIAIKIFEVYDKRHDYEYTNAMRAWFIELPTKMQQFKTSIVNAWDKWFPTPDKTQPTPNNTSLLRCFSMFSQTAVSTMQPKTDWPSFSTLLCPFRGA